MAVGMNKMSSKARTARKLESDLMNAGVHDPWRITLQVHKKFNR